MACMQSPSVTKSRGRRYSRTAFLLTARTACLAQRFGGENGGMTVAVHYASFVCYPCGNVGCEPCVATPRKSSPSLCVLFRRSSKRAAACCAAHDVAPYLLSQTFLLVPSPSRSTDLFDGAGTTPRRLVWDLPSRVAGCAFISATCSQSASAMPPLLCRSLIPQTHKRLFGECSREGSLARVWCMRLTRRCV